MFARRRRSSDRPRRVSALVRAIEENDDAQIEAAIRRLSRRHRLLAPLALAVSAFVLLFDALKLLVANWRLMLVQILPAMWIWLAMFDLKVHVLHGKSFNVVRGPLLIPICLVIVAITAASFFLNAVFAFAVSQGRHPTVRPAMREARCHLRPILISGGATGGLLAFATVIVTRWGRPWFGITLSMVVGLMMLAYVAVPARLIGVKPAHSRRDKLTTTAVGGVLGATVSGPPYLLGRLGLLMLGSKPLFIPGIILLAIGVTLQAGATGAVRAIKMSVKLTGSDRPADSGQSPPQQVPQRLVH